MPTDEKIDYGRMPDERGHFGPYGGIFVAETLMEPLTELRLAYETYMQDEQFLAELDADLQKLCGTSLTAIPL